MEYGSHPASHVGNASDTGVGFFVRHTRFQAFAQDSYLEKFSTHTTLKKPSGSVENQQSYKLLLGKHGKSVSELYPTGQIEIEGLRYDARSSLGKIAKGENVEVFKVSEFELVVKPLES